MATKSRITYAQFIAQQQKKQLTIAVIISRYMDAMNGTNGEQGIRPLGQSQMYSFGAMKRSSIGKVGAFDLKHHHVIAYARERAITVKPPTIMHDLSDLSVVLKYAGAAWDDCLGLSAEPVKVAKHFLSKHGIAQPSRPRDRRPTPEELETLIWYYHFPPAHGKAREIDMALMTYWQYASGRRISESCRALWTQWNREEQTLVVVGMKDPRTRKKTKTVALTPEAQALLEALWEVRDPNEPRIFPYNSKSISASYTLAKHRIGINGLRLHDSRRECSSRLVERGYSAPEAILFTGHDSTKIFEKTYMRLKPEDARHGPIAQRRAQQAAP